MATLLERILKQSKKGKKALVHQAFITQVTECIWEEMSRQEVRSVDLARRLKLSRSAVSQLLAGDNNFTLGKLSEMAEALDAKPIFHLIPRSVRLTNLKPTHCRLVWKAQTPVNAEVALPAQEQKKKERTFTFPNGEPLTEAVNVRESIAA